MKSMQNIHTGIYVLNRFDCSCFFHSNSNTNLGTMITYYEVKSSLNGGVETDHTNGFVTTDYCQTQSEPDQYGEVEIRDNVDKVLESFVGSVGTYTLN